MRGVEKLLELRVGDGVFVDEEGNDLHLALVESARCILPWILHIDAGVSVPFDLSALNAEDEIATGNADHACGSFGGGSGGRDGDDGLEQDGVLVREKDAREAPLS